MRPALGPGMGKHAAGLLSLILLATGCTASATGADLFAAPQATEPEPGPVPPEPCVSIDAACQDGERTYSTVQACTAAGEDLCRRVTTPECAGGTIYCGSRQAQCLAFPSCDDGDDEVAGCGQDDDCYTRSICGSTIVCRRPTVTCDAIPVCDAGDVEVWGVDTCKQPNVECYSRTVCGTTIWCVDQP